MTANKAHIKEENIILPMYLYIEVKYIAIVIKNIDNVNQYTFILFSLQNHGMYGIF